MSRITIFGIRHHGPGCAHSLRAALDQLNPDIILLEGPADAEKSLPLATHEQMCPPVAMIVYPTDEPRRSICFPLAEFSPEWQTIRWAGRHGVDVRLMDLPMTHRMALDRKSETQPQSLPTEVEEKIDSSEAEASTQYDRDSDANTWRADPIALLAEAAGYHDHEFWWEEQIERRQDATDLFAAIQEAMQTVREEFPETREGDLLRESFMRKTIRQVMKQDYQRIAVVCGAWHGPVLDEHSLAGKRDGCRIKDDNARLKGLPKLKTTSTWIPWTHSRLAYRSGYGAGIESPGWYAQLWESPDDAELRWITSAARLLRERDLEASSASVLEASRLAETLAAIRERCAPGLDELNDAIQSVFCQGDATPIQLIRRELEVGNCIGSVPEETPSVPLAEDLAKLQKSLRMKPSVGEKLLDLDLRKAIGLQRSHLLHRLNLLGIPWGELQQSGGGVSTFHEIWKLDWQPDFAVSVIEANVWGNTVESASAAKLVQQSRQEQELSRLANLLNVALLADLNSAIPLLLARIRTTSSIATDVSHLMEAVLPLARISRYSNVRGTQAKDIDPILREMIERIIVGLPGACSSLDDDAAEKMLSGVLSTQAALDLIDQSSLIDDWTALLRKLVTAKIHALIRGAVCRLLLEKNVIDNSELESITRLELSPATPIGQAASWLTGLLKGSGLLLLHQETLWHILDEWLVQLTAESFQEMLPLLRRAFSDFSGPERRQMGERLKHLSTQISHSRRDVSSEKRSDINHDRAAKVLPILAKILGVPHDN